MTIINNTPTYVAKDGRTFTSEADCLRHERGLRRFELAQLLWDSALETYSEECLICGYFGWAGSSDDVILIRANEENVAALKELWSLHYGEQSNFAYEPTGNLIFLQGVAEGRDDGLLDFFDADTVLADLAMELQTLEAEVARKAEEASKPKKYHVVVHYEGAFVYDIEAASEDEAKDMAMTFYDSEDADAFLENLADADVCDCYEEE